MHRWTTLQNCERCPTEELARHYTERWEYELYFRELNLDVRNAPALASQIPETALQEIAALVLPSAVLAPSARGSGYTTEGSTAAHELL